HVANTLPLTSASTSTQRAPDFVEGRVASGAGILVAEPIRKKFIDGWKTHVPLHFLTDKYCSFSNRASTKEINNTWALDTSGNAIISVAKELDHEPELRLSFEDWFQAQSRLLELIATHLSPRLHAAWSVHFENIIRHPNRSLNWSAWLEYDSLIRRRTRYEDFDPSIFHLTIWNEIESKHIANRAIAAVQTQFMGKAPTQTSLANNRGHPYAEGTKSFRTDTPRCFVCGSVDPNHKSRSCNSRRLANGKPVIILSKEPGAPRRDRQGNAYCFPFNGARGCEESGNCHNGKHWCTLCGGRDGRHNAQNCSSL
ncbi:hypothetical protein FB45DRAFT_741687, partial [Roridomyces roridus]